MAQSAPHHKPISLVIVEDNNEFQAALAQHLDGSADVTLAGVAHSSAEALALPVELKPDAVLLDMHLPDGFGLNLIMPLRRLWPGTHIIVLTLDDDPNLRELALTMGARDFVAKMDAAAQLVPVLERCVRGRR